MVSPIAVSTGLIRTFNEATIFASMWPLLSSPTGKWVTEQFGRLLVTCNAFQWVKIHMMLCLCSLNFRSRSHSRGIVSLISLCLAMTLCKEPATMSSPAYWKISHHTLSVCVATSPRNLWALTKLSPLPDNDQMASNDHCKQLGRSIQHKFVPT